MRRSQPTSQRWCGHSDGSNDTGSENNTDIIEYDKSIDDSNGNDGDIFIVQTAIVIIKMVLVV